MVIEGRDRKSVAKTEGVGDLKKILIMPASTPDLCRWFSGSPTMRGSNPSILNYFSWEMNIKIAGLWTSIVLSFGCFICLSLILLPLFNGLLRRSTHAWNHSDHFTYSLGTGLSLLIHIGRIHSRSPGYRNHCHYNAGHSRKARLTASGCAYAIKQPPGQWCEIRWTQSGS